MQCLCLVFAIRLWGQLMFCTHVLVHFLWDEMGLGMDWRIPCDGVAPLHEMGVETPQVAGLLVSNGEGIWALWLGCKT